VQNSGPMALPGSACDWRAWQPCGLGVDASHDAGEVGDIAVVERVAKCLLKPCMVTLTRFLTSDLPFGVILAKVTVGSAPERIPLSLRSWYRRVFSWRSLASSSTKRSRAPSSVDSFMNRSGRVFPPDSTLGSPHGIDLGDERPRIHNGRSTPWTHRKKVMVTAYDKDRS
jgi:hypothetical protein